MAALVIANETEIRRQSGQLKGVFLLAGIVMAGALGGKHVVWPLVRVAGGAKNGEPAADVWGDVALNLIGAMPAFLLLFGVVAAYGVFARMSEGAIFTPANAAAVRAIGAAMLWASGAAILIAPSLAGWVRGDTTIDIAFPDWALLLAVLGAAVLLMGRVLGLATAIKTDNEQIV